METTTDAKSPCITVPKNHASVTRRLHRQRCDESASLLVPALAVRPGCPGRTFICGSIGVQLPRHNNRASTVVTDRRFMDFSIALCRHIESGAFLVRTGYLSFLIVVPRWHIAPLICVFPLISDVVLRNPRWKYWSQVSPMLDSRMSVRCRLA